MVVHSSDNNDRRHNRNHHLIPIPTRVQTSKGSFINDVTQIWDFFDPTSPLSHPYALSLIYLCHTIANPTLLCISTSERVLRPPFAGRNQFFTAKTNFCMIFCIILY